jgi:hypothetical protein
MDNVQKHNIFIEGQYLKGNLHLGNDTGQMNSVCAYTSFLVPPSVLFPRQ